MGGGLSPVATLLLPRSWLSLRKYSPRPCHPACFWERPGPSLELPPWVTFYKVRLKGSISDSLHQKEWWSSTLAKTKNILGKSSAAPRQVSLSLLLPSFLQFLKYCFRELALRTHTWAPVSPELLHNLILCLHEFTGKWGSWSPRWFTAGRRWRRRMTQLMTGWNHEQNSVIESITEKKKRWSASQGSNQKKERKGKKSTVWDKRRVFEAVLWRKTWMLVQDKVTLSKQYCSGVYCWVTNHPNSSSVVCRNWQADYKICMEMQNI